MTTTVRLSIGNRPNVAINILSVTTVAVSGHTAGWDLTLSAAPPEGVIVTDKVTIGTDYFLIKNINGSVLTVVGDAFFHINPPIAGAASSDRSFANHYQAFVLCSNKDMRAVNWVYQCEYYREGSGANGEWVFGDTNNQHLSNCLGDSTRYFFLTTAPGQSFIDKYSNSKYPLKYDTTLGVSIKLAQTFSTGIFVNATVPKATGESAFRCFGIMFDGVNQKPVLDGGVLGVAGIHCAMYSCIVKNGIIRNSIFTINSVFYTSGPSICGSNSIWDAINCTMISTSGTGPMITPGNYMSARLKNCAVFGFSAVSSNPAKINTAQSFALATDLATDGTALGIPNSLYNLNSANQFISLATGAEDLQLINGSDLINAGRQVAQNENIDVTGRPRNPLTPSIGAAEQVWYPLVIVQSDQTITKGIARGIERGIV